MTGWQVALVLAAACLHAGWNLLAKRASGAGVAFVAAYSLLSAPLYLPLAAWAWWRFGADAAGGWLGWACIGLSGVLHTAYALVLQRAYRAGDMSVVYPVARGVSPTIAALGALLLLGEAATPPRLAGLALVVGGIALLAGFGRRLADPAARPGVAWGAATGVTSASYVLVDGWGVKALGVHPVLLDWGGNLVRCALLLPGVLRDRAGFRSAMQGHWRAALGVAALAPAGYMAVLWVLSTGAPLSAVAPMREVSMMAGTLLAVAVLGEPLTARRLGGCALIVAGVALLAY